MIPKSIQSVIEQLSTLPSIGPKTAERLTFFLLRQPPHYLDKLGNAIMEVQQGLHRCPTCATFTETIPCGICSNEKRDQRSICVVEDFLDMVAIEKAKSYQGVYHVLHGSLAPLQGIGPRQLTINLLEERLNDTVDEVILATNPTLEGEATAMYIKNLMGERFPHIRLSRIAKGIPMGGDIEYADDVTITNSLQQRTIY